MEAVKPIHILLLKTVVGRPLLHHPIPSGPRSIVKPEEVLENPSNSHIEGVGA